MVRLNRIARVKAVKAHAHFFKDDARLLSSTQGRMDQDE